MTRQLTDDEKAWIAVERGDQETARRLMQAIGVDLLFGRDLDRLSQLRLGLALVRYSGSPTKFFGTGRRGPSASKAAAKFEVWAIVAERKSAVALKGGGQVDVFADVADELEMNERTVRDWYETVQTTLKKYKTREAVLHQGIASLLP